MKEKDIQKLIDRAIVARDKTYSPYLRRWNHL